MKILFLGDLHIGARNGNPNFLAMMNTFYTDELFPYIKNHNIDFVIQLGDILDKRRNVDFLVSNYIINTFFRFFEENSIPFYSLLGNHDVYYRQSVQIDGPSQLVKSDYIRIIKEPTEFVFDNRKICLIPWICDENLKDIQKFLCEHRSKNTLVAGHFELAGFQIQKGYISEKGTISTEELRGFRRVISGHYHSPSENGNITYLGTPYELTWGDYGDEKRLMIYDTENDNFEIYPTKIKLYHKILYDDEKFRTIDYSLYKNSYIKVILADDYNEGKLNMFLSMLDEKAHPYGIQTIDVREQQETLVEEISTEDINNPIEIMMSTIDNRVQDKELAQMVKELTYKIFRDAMEQSQ